MSKGTYPDNWTDIAHYTKCGAEWRCARCGKLHDHCNGYTLTVHHFDGDPSNCEPWNLMPLCQRCHLSVQNRVTVEQGIMLTPSTWILPYVAGAIAAGRTAPVPGSDLDAWISSYETDGRRWPMWAPRRGLTPPDEAV